MTVEEVLINENRYPIPKDTLKGIATRRGFDLSAEATPDLLRSPEVRLGFADLYVWLMSAPDITQGGQSYSFTDGQRVRFKQQANATYRIFGEYHSIITNQTSYGYKGSKL